MAKSVTKSLKSLQKLQGLGYIPGGDYVINERFKNNLRGEGISPKGHLHFGTFGVDTNPFDFRVYERTYGYRTGGLGSYQTPQLLLNSMKEQALPGDRYDLGHDFWNIKCWSDLSHPDFYARSPLDPSGRYASGPLVLQGQQAAYSPSEIPLFLDPGILDVNLYGNRAISKIAPTVPKANVAQTLAEIQREGIQLPWENFSGWLKSRTSTARAIGGEYLNVAFGWVPLISDLQKVIKSALSATDIIKQYYKDEGQIVRRRLAFPTIHETTETVIGEGRVNVSPQSSNIAYGWEDMYMDGDAAGTLYQTNFRSEKIWFSGAFQYSFSTDDSLLGKLKEYEFLANQLLGSRITPAVLWELAPWSWLVDWIAEIQNAVTTASLLQSDNLVMRYGYLMRTTVLKRTYTVKGIDFWSYPNNTTYSASINMIKKERVKGTPFGFGVDLSSLSGQQWAILGALSLTRAPNILGP